MVNYFIINALMLIGLISITYLFYNARRDFFMRHHNLTKILLGIFAGVAGAFLMNQS